MTPELKTQWIEELKSGKYPKGKHSLHIMNRETGEHSYCCLGVLCEIMQVKSSLDDKELYNEFK